MHPARTSLVYLTDIVEIARRGSSLLDAMVFSLIASASVAPVRQDPDLDHAYATLEAPPPDGLRRPITINAVAASLGLPFESVRRAAGRLADLGEIEITRRGVIQPEARVDAPDQVALSLGLYRRTRRLHAELQAAAHPAFREPAPEGRLGEAPVRLVHRVVGIYALRVVTRLCAWVGPPHRTLVYMEAMRSALSPPPEDGVAEGPVRSADVARRCGLPAETVRRHLNTLTDMGLLMREGRLLLIGPESRGEAAQAQAQAAAVDFRRLLEQLDRYGVRAWWNAEPDAVGAGGISATR